jgi:hypothetical protein
MKKLFVLFICFLAVVSVSAQSVSPTIDPSFFDAIYNFVTSKIAAGVVMSILTIAWILEQIIPYVKWMPGNSTLAVIWNVFKKIVAFLASKKK